MSLLKVRNRWLFVCVTVATCSTTAFVTVSRVAGADSQVSVRPSAEMFDPPKVILAPTIAGDSPAGPWCFPTDPVKVIRQISAWLSTATPVQIQLPTSNRNLVFNAYIGPA